MKKKTKIFFCVILSLIAIIFISILVSNIRYQLIYKNQIASLDNNTLTPSFDFIQPWMAADFEVEDWENHIDTLKEVGYQGLIFQYSRSSGDFYFPETNMESVYDGKIDTSKSYIMERMFEACDNKDFKVFVGLSIDDQWWNFKQYANEDYLLSLSKIDDLMVDELLDLYGEHESFYGWYWAYELLTNIHGYEKGWAEMLNRLFDHLHEINDSKPLMLSPFKHKLLSGSNNDTYKMWKNFFLLAEFRKGDIFAPQDSIGKISDSDINKKALAKTYDFIKSISEASKNNSNVTFYVNCELFATSSLFKEDLHTASYERILKQYEIASKFSSGIITFSYSHYIAPSGPNNTQINKNEIHNKMIEIYKK